MSKYTQFLKSRSKSEIRNLAHIKRFLERYSGDEDYRNSINNNELDLKTAAKMCGCEIDLETLRPVFHPEYIEKRQTATKEEWPLTHLWNMHMTNMHYYRGEIITSANSQGLTPLFDAWRDRQIVRSNIDLGPGASGIVHPPIAFEISDGCSVGCWFCGISAKKFKGHFSLKDDGAQYWREMLQGTQRVLGPGMNHGFCYWATEPLDNPEYAEFLEIFYEVTGIMPQTTSAIPLRNIELTRKVLKLWEKSRFTVNRFSILTPRILKQVHEEFTPEELLGVELVLQNVGSESIKSAGGRAFKYKPEKGEQTKEAKKSTMTNSTIACVSGFLVNILRKTIRLVSPTMPSEKWPNGYVVHAEAVYTDTEDYERKLLELIEANMELQKLKTDLPIRFDENFTYMNVDGHFAFTNDAIVIESKLFEKIGPMIADGDMSPKDIVKKYTKEGGNPFLVAKLLDEFNTYGLVQHTG